MIMMTLFVENMHTYNIQINEIQFLAMQVRYVKSISKMYIKKLIKIIQI